MFGISWCCETGAARKVFAMDLSPGWQRDAEAQVRVSRPDGFEAPVRLRLLGYDGCEFETDVAFSPGEEVRIHIYRMGSIRAHIISQQSRVVEIQFDRDCPT
jgi:hypothetical protein